MAKKKAAQKSARGRALKSNTNTDFPLLIPVGTVAKLMSISVRTVWRMVDKGEMPAPIRLGGITRWQREEIEKWISYGCPAPK